MSNVFGFLSLVSGALMVLMGVSITPIDLLTPTIDDFLHLHISIVLILGGFFFIIAGIRYID